MASTQFKIPFEAPGPGSISPVRDRGDRLYLLNEGDRGKAGRIGCASLPGPVARLVPGEMSQAGSATGLPTGLFPFRTQSSGIAPCVQHLATYPLTRKSNNWMKALIRGVEDLARHGMKW